MNSVGIDSLFSLIDIFFFFNEICNLCHYTMSKCDTGINVYKVLKHNIKIVYNTSYVIHETLVENSHPSKTFLFKLIDMT